jgi:hypothetical protein
MRALFCLFTLLWLRPGAEGQVFTGQASGDTTLVFVSVFGTRGNNVVLSLPEPGAAAVTATLTPGHITINSAGYASSGPLSWEDHFQTVDPNTFGPKEYSLYVTLTHFEPFQASSSTLTLQPRSGTKLTFNGTGAAWSPSSAHVLGSYTVQGPTETFSGAIDVTIPPSGSQTVNGSIDVAQYPSAIGIDLSSSTTGYPNTTLFSVTVDNLLVYLRLDGLQSYILPSSSGDITLTAVPEPSEEATIVGTCALAAAILSRRGRIFCRKRSDSRSRKSRQIIPPVCRSDGAS